MTVIPLLEPNVKCPETQGIYQSAVVDEELYRTQRGDRPSGDAPNYSGDPETVPAVPWKSWTQGRSDYIAALIAQNNGLRQALMEAEHELGRHSVRRRVSIWSYVALATFSVLLAVQLIRGSVILSSPVAEVGVLVSLVVMLMVLPSGRDK